MCKQLNVTAFIVALLGQIYHSLGMFYILNKYENIV